ncbi:MAG: PqqD family protein [Microthrixaceae bacterium]|nr:PqqD family protein [Microthrixaceae bacterium]
MKSFRHTGGLTWDRVDDRVVVLDADGSSMITLNPIASILWPELDRQASAECLVRMLSSRFTDVSTEQLRHDVDAFLDELLSEGSIEVAEPA